MIIDAFCFFNELDLLELRLEILGPYTDKFILVESRETFSGIPKPLYYEENKEKFAKWQDKIIHIIVPNLALMNPDRLFERHWYAYELIEEKLQDFDPETIVFSSDLDEVWNPEILKKFEDGTYPLDKEIYTLSLWNYSYYLNMRSSEGWMDSLVTRNKNVFPGFTKRYRTEHQPLIENAGWHFTNVGGVEQIIKKIEAYDHANEVLPTLSNYKGYGIKERMEQGYDYLGRQYDYWGKPFSFYLSEEEWPQFLKDNKERYQHLCK
jgi:hypothetical protein